MLFTLFPPAELNFPPTYIAPFHTANAKTLLLVPFTAPPKACQLDPSQDAIWLARTPPAFVKNPAAYNLELYTSSALISLFVPVLRFTHVLRFASHLAMLLPPVKGKLPAA